MSIDITWTVKDLSDRFNPFAALIVAIGSAQDGEVGIKDFEYRQGGLVW